MALMRPSEIRRPSTASTFTFEELKALEASQPRRTDRPEELRLDAIDVAASAFQWRDLASNQAADTAHMQELIRVLKETRKALDPILVTAIGNRFFLIDGHHRFDAYCNAGWSEPVPVDYFEGPLQSALEEALLRNTKNKLPMTSQDKLEAAWRLVNQGLLTRNEIVRATTVSKRTLATMAKTLKDHSEASSMHWRKARRLQWGNDIEISDDWLEEKARKWAAQWVRNMPADFSKKPDVMARALELLDESLPRKLVTEWPDVAREVLEDYEAEGSEFDL